MQVRRFWMVLVIVVLIGVAMGQHPNGNNGKPQIPPSRPTKEQAPQFVQPPPQLSAEEPPEQQQSSQYSPGRPGNKKPIPRRPSKSTHSNRNKTRQSQARLKNNQKQSQKTNIYLIKLIIIVVICIFLLVALLILKPCFLKKSKSQQNAVQTRNHINLHQEAQTNINNIVIVQTQYKIIKDRFINHHPNNPTQPSLKNLDEVREAQLPSLNEQGSMTPSFGSFTFRNNM